jgi:hypothetical protein
MGMYEDWKNRNPEINSEKQVANVEFVLKMLDSLTSFEYPVGSYYTQYSLPNGSFSVDETPNKLFKGLWEIQFSTEGVFFRTEGGQAGDQRQSNGIQGDRIRNITGSVKIQKVWGSSRKQGIVRESATGALGYTSDEAGYYHAADISNLATQPHGITFNAASSGVPVGTDNAPRNRLIRVYKRIS